ncbi:MAG: ATPase, T2SS/T4P/T4SS family [Ilumatobacteraceae bacterium]
MFNPDPTLVTLLQATVAAGASDLHLSVGRPPTACRDGTLVPFEGVSVLAPPDTERIVFSLLADYQRKELDEVQQVDFSFGIDGLGRRFRANAFKQRNTYALALRVVPYRVRSLEELGAPEAANDLLNRPYGLVLVVGPTGSGKSARCRSTARDAGLRSGVDRSAVGRSGNERLPMDPTWDESGIRMELVRSSPDLTGR